MAKVMTKQERKERDADFELRLQPRLVWDSKENGTVLRIFDGGYAKKPKVIKKKRQLTEAQDNAIGRAIRRRLNKAMRGWLPYAKR